MSTDDATSTGAGDLVYVSWGGTGRAASVRKAMQRALTTDRPLRYLAVLDDEHFADLDRLMIGLVTDELEWLLDAQIELTRSQLKADDLDVQVEVAAGRVLEVLRSRIDESGRTEVLIGAPVPVIGHHSITDVLDQISGWPGCTAEVVMPDAS